MSAQGSSEEETCRKCVQIITTSPSVRCLKCRAIYHESCVKVNDNMQIWQCIICKDDENSQGLHPPKTPRSNRSRRSEKPSSHASSTVKEDLLKAFDEESELLKQQAREKAKLLEKQMQHQQQQAKEEEAFLKATHEKQLELVKRKQAALAEMGSSRGSVRSKVSVAVPSISGREKVESWINSSSKQPVTAKIQVTPPVQVNGDFDRDAIHSSTQFPDPQHVSISVPRKTQVPVVPSNPNVTFNLTGKKQTVSQVAEATSEERKTLSREEIAARHVVKSLPNFDGNPRFWPKFLSSYHRSTKVCGFNNTENLDRLSVALTGSAYAAVHSCLTMEENVPRILHTLEMLYGKPEFIISALLEDLSAAPAPTYGDTDSILAYALEIDNISSTMVHAKLADHLWNPLLLNDMISKLPTQLQHKWADYKKDYNSPCSIEVFSVWLKDRAFTYASILSKPPNLNKKEIRKENKKESKHSINLHQPSHSQTKRCAVCQKSCACAKDCEKFKNFTLQEKWNAVRRHQICRTCLKRHPGRRCDEDIACGIDGCEFRHHRLLHNKKEGDTDDEVKDVPAMNLHTDSKTLFKILPVFLSNGERKLWTYAMFDDGSSLTLVDNSIADALNLDGERQALCLRWTNGLERRDASSKIVCLNVSQSPGSQIYKLRDVRTIENLQLPTQSVDIKTLSSLHSHLKDVDMSSFKNARPLLLIGLNHPKLLEVQKYKFGEDDEPAAAKTPLGWCLFGSKATKSGSVLHVQHCNCEEKLDKRLEDMVRENYSLEAIGISNPSSLPQAKAEKTALDILNSTVKLCGRRYETGLLWKYKNKKLPNSLPMARRRLKCLENKCQSDPSLRFIINQQLEDYVKKGYAKKLDPSALQETDVWYLPIFVVRNHNKPDKIRIVWDAAATSNGVSLNDVLLKGPDFLTSLPGVLLRFRENKVAISGDIKEMFHQISVKESDRRYQRFLWRSSENSEVEVFEMCVLTFGACCSPSCSQFVKNLNAARFDGKYHRAVEAIQNNHYVDDWLQSVDSPEEAVELATQVKRIHHEGGFLIHKWISNSPEVVRNLQDVPSVSEKSMELSPKFDVDKVLGMSWTTTLDNFQFTLKINDVNTKMMNGEKVPTKREILKFLMSIFDPLGLIAPVLIFPKILLQEIWRSKLDWDDKIDLEQHVQWTSWSKNLQSLSTLRIPRWIGLQSGGSEIEVHTFVDASEDAFAAAVYFKVISSSGNTHCSLITSKSRVAPLKSLSIPRLELQAAVLGTRLAKFAMSNSSTTHTFSKCFYWTDSETVMKWLHSDSRKYTQYVSCRIGEILESSRVSEWSWIPGRQNVADLATKMRLFDEDQLTNWFQGPKFLFSDPGNYPIKKPHYAMCEEELRPNEKFHQVALHEEVEYRVNKWRKLRRIHAFAYRFISNCQLHHRKKPLLKGPLSSQEYLKGEIYLIKKAQLEGYSEEYSQLDSGLKITNRRSPIYKDSPFIDESGIMRARGRNQSSPYASYNMKNPILLPRNHPITEIILHYYHERYHHMYISTVLNEVKQKFVVTRLKVKLREIRKQCQFCRNRDARPLIPEEGELPPARITPFFRPFTYIGIDYFGPVQVVIGRGSAKRWVMLVTCLTTRAVHLETVQTLTTDSCILALTRFMNRRGKPREIYTDNGTNFHGSKRELREIWQNIDKEKVAERFIDDETEWMFIPPASPHMGGAWERMVRTVKTSLKVAMPFKIANDELLYSMLTEVENVINNRPLTYVEIDQENQEALTPNHFILGSSSGSKPLGEFKDDSSYLRANWHKSQKFSNIFWKRWVAEYLPTLNRRTKWFQSQSKELMVGDVVIVLGEDKRGSWPKGRVIKVHRSRDNLVRSADVQLETGIYTRPVSKIAVLDVRRSDDDGTLANDTRIPGGSVDVTQNISIEAAADPMVLLPPSRRRRVPMPHRS